MVTFSYCVGAIEEFSVCSIFVKVNSKIMKVFNKKCMRTIEKIVLENATLSEEKYEYDADRRPFSDHDRLKIFWTNANLVGVNRCLRRAHELL